MQKINPEYILRNGDQIAFQYKRHDITIVRNVNHIAYKNEKRC